MVGILQAYQSGSSLFPSMPSQSSFIFDQIRTTAAQRFVDKKSAIDDTAKSRMDAIAAQDDRWISVKAQINNAKIAVESGKESIANVRQMLLELRTSIALAADPKEDFDLRKSEFDAKIAAINSEADTGGLAFNLVGAINDIDYAPNEIEYRNNLGAGTTTLVGTNIAGDYRIEASDGTVWIPDLGSDLLQQFSALQGQKMTIDIGGNTIDKATSIRNGANLVSYNPANNDITVEITINPTDPPETVTGKLRQDGIKIMSSWFYDGLATDAGRKRAFAAINNAEVELTLAEGKIEQAAAQVSRDERRVDNELSLLTTEKGKAMTVQLTDTEKLQIETQQQLIAMQTNLDSLSQQQANYLNAFGGFLNSKLSQFQLHNITA